MEKTYKTIDYKIDFLSEWHCGSGLSAGADIDALVIRDKQQFPFIPGKTIKGLVRQTFETICDLDGKFNSVVLDETFGSKVEKTPEESTQVKHRKGATFFTNAELSYELKKDILDSTILPYLFRKRTSTAIDDNGIAKDHSLRSLETVIPCSLTGQIIDVPEEAEEALIDALKMVKRLGVGRNRGLGRCRITIKKEGETYE